MTIARQEQTLVTWPYQRLMTSQTGDATHKYVVTAANPIHLTPPCRLERFTEMHLDGAPWPAGAPPTAPPTLCRLSAKLDRGTQGHYTAAHEFCRISGLLCSYGNLVQEVRDNILATFCKGPTSSFTVQVVVQDSQGNRESGQAGLRR